EGEAYGYARAFTYAPSPDELRWIADNLLRSAGGRPVVLDPTAAGGSIPFEAVRLGVETFANDLNTVAVLIERATVELTLKYGAALLTAYRELARRFVPEREARLRELYPPEPEQGCVATNYLWARTISCPYCEGIVPLSPNWRLAADGTGVKLVPDTKVR